MNTETLVLALAILSSSFWGSWHCAAMCGPIASVAARSGSLALYHLGRGLSYVALGALGGALGSFFLGSEFETMRVIAGAILALLLIVMGVQTARGLQTFRSPRFRWLHSRYTKATPGFLLGAFAVFLPCGWLYTYVLAAVATRSAWSGALLMFLFWLAGLPALSAVPVAMKKAIAVSPKRKQLIAGLVLVFAGLYSLAGFYSAML